MILMTGTSDLIQFASQAAIYTGGTPNFNVHTSYIDFLAGGTMTPGRTNTNISSTSTTTIVGSPAANTSRDVKTINIFNAGSGTNSTFSPLITYTDGTTPVNLLSIWMAAGELLTYIEGQGWKMYDSNGRPKIWSALELGYVLQNIQYFTTTGAGTYNKTNGINLIKITCIGGGGGGGGTTTTASNSAFGGGGGGGGMSQTTVLSPSNSYSISVGVGGTAGSTAGGNGGTGGDSTFGSVSICTGKGGSGGTGMTAGSTVVGAVGGNGGLSSSGVGDIKYDGSGGGLGVRFSATVGYTGFGGEVAFGGSNIVSATAAGAGTTGSNYGGGGSGGAVVNGSTAVAGGVGGQGIIIVEEYA